MTLAEELKQNADYYNSYDRVKNDLIEALEVVSNTGSYIYEVDLLPRLCHIEAITQDKFISQLMQYFVLQGLKVNRLGFSSLKIEWV